MDEIAKEFGDNSSEEAKREARTGVTTAEPTKAKVRINVQIRPDTKNLPHTPQSRFDGIPPNPSSRRLVNDYADVMAHEDEIALESVLRNFSDQTTTQVTVVTVLDMAGYDKAEFALKIGEAWGVGNADNDNGVVMIVKPKTAESRGDAFIGTGYGLESVLPDVLCSRIVNDEMIPHFKEGDYGTGIIMGVMSIVKATQGEYVAKPSSDDGDDTSPILAIIIIIAVILLFLFSDSKSNSGGKGGRGGSSISSSGAAWIIGSMLRGGGSGFGGGGGFSGGGFGGFGGGSFGGGGGGGSW